MKNHHMRITPRPIILCEGGDQLSAERKEALEASGATVKELAVDGELLCYFLPPIRILTDPLLQNKAAFRSRRCFGRTLSANRSWSREEHPSSPPFSPREW